jgi:dTDP-4-dehydrorhamnose 3,5-epimerase
VRFLETRLAGAYVIEVDRIEDERGFFARSFARDEFAARGLRTDFVQSSISFNARAGTLRGMHYQVPPHAETKLVRCTRGAIFDVIVDLRPGSPTARQWTSAELTARNHRMLYVPEGFAHGFVTLLDESEVFYEITAYYDASAARGVRWDDPVLGIAWPRPPVVLSERDRALPRLDAA